MTEARAKSMRPRRNLDFASGQSASYGAGVAVGGCIPDGPCCAPPGAITRGGLYF